MAGRTPMVALLVLTLTVGVGAAAEMRLAVDRPDIVDIGDPTLISRQLLRLEMDRNVELDTYVGLYGMPEYAEVQEVQVEEPFAPYEVRLYYLRRNLYLAFARVHVAPSVHNYGVRKFEGSINAQTLARLLTARAPAAEQPAPGAAQGVSMPDEPIGAAPAEMEDVEVGAVETAVEADVAGVDEPDADLPVASLDKGVMDAVVRMEAAADRAAIAAGVAERAGLAATASADQATATLERVIAAQEE